MLLQSSASKANSIKSQAASTVFYWKLLGFYLLKTLNVRLDPTIFSTFFPPQNKIPPYIQ